MIESMPRRSLACALGVAVSLLAVACTPDRAPEAVPAPFAATEAPATTPTSPAATVTPARTPTPVAATVTPASTPAPTPVIEADLAPASDTRAAPPFSAGVTNMPDALDPSVLGMSPLELLEASDEAMMALEWVRVVERIREGPGWRGGFDSSETRYQWGGPGMLEAVFVSRNGEPSDEYRRGPFKERWLSERAMRFLAGRSLTDFSVPASDVRLIAEEVVDGRPAWVIWYGFQMIGIDSFLRFGRTEWIAKDDLVLLSQVEDSTDTLGAPAHFTRILSDFNDPPDTIEHNYNPLFYELAADIPFSRQRGVDGNLYRAGSPWAVRHRLPFVVALPANLPASWRLSEGALFEPLPIDESKLSNLLTLEFRNAELSRSFTLRQGSELDWRAAGDVPATLARDVQAVASDVTACSDGGSCGTVRVGWFSCDRGFELTMPPGADPLDAIDFASSVAAGCTP